MYRPPKVTIPNARINGESVTGVFEFPDDVQYELAVETDALFQSHGSVAAVSSVILEQYDQGGDTNLGEGLRQELSLDVGMGRHVCTVDFRSFTGSPHQWGTGDGTPQTDASGDQYDVHRQAAVLDKFLNTATLDSTNPAILEVGEYSEEGVYAPMTVVPRNPTLRFDSTQSSSVIDGSVDWVETQALENQTAPQHQR